MHLATRTAFPLNSWSLLCEINTFSHERHICTIEHQQGASRNPRFACCMFDGTKLKNSSEDTLAGTQGDR